MNIGKRVVEIVIKATDESSSAFGGMGKKLAELSKQYPALAIIGAASIGQIIGKIGDMVAAIGRAYQANVELGASFQDLSNRTDMSVESLAKWKYVAEQNGATLDDFEMVFKKLRKTMADAASGEQESIDIYKRLGVEYKDNTGKLRDLETVLLEIGQVIREHGMASIEAAAGQDALGRNSGKVVAVIKQQSDELKAQMALGAAYTNSMTATWAATADAADDAAARAKIASENIRAALMPDMSAVTDWWTDLRLAMFNAKGWVQVQKANEEAAKAAAHAVAVSYLDSLISVVGDQAGPAVDAARGELIGIARDFGVAVSETIFDPKANQWVNQNRTAEAIAADLTAAMNKVPEKIVVPEGMIPDKITAAVDLESSGMTIGADDVTTLEDYEEAMQQLRTVQEEMAALGTPAIMDAEVIAAGDEALQRLIESQQEAEDAQQAMTNAATGAIHGIGQVASAGLQAMMNGTQGAMMFGRMIRTVVITALADMLTQLLIIGPLMRLFGLSGGGKIPGFAQGGQIQHAANGYAVPDGPRGMDSRLIAAMPGEEVINRNLSRRLERMVSAYEFGAAVSPFALPSAGGGRGQTVFQFNVGRPTSVLDGLAYGEAAATTMRKYNGANL